MNYLYNREKTMKYVIYLRVSTEMQDERTQLEHCLAHIRSRDKGEFQHVVYQDIMSSRKKLKNREGISSALQCLQKDDILVGMRIDRLARNTRESYEIVEQIKKKGAHLVLVDQSTEMLKNKIVFNVLVGVAEEETKMLSKRILEKLAIKRVKNERISRHLPYGYKLDEENLIDIKNRDKSGFIQKAGKLIEDTREQEVLKIMLNLSSQGVSYHKICIALEKQGYLNRVNQPFHPMSVCRILNRINPSKSLDQSQSESKFALFQ